MTVGARVVFDCNTLLQGLASPFGPAGRCVDLALSGFVQLVVSPLTIAELRDVASRPRVAAKLAITRDRDLLDLMSASTTTGAAFRSRFPEMRITDRVTFLREIDL